MLHGDDAEAHHFLEIRFQLVKVRNLFVDDSRFFLAIMNMDRPSVRIQDLGMGTSKMKLKRLGWLVIIGMHILYDGRLACA